MSAPAFTKVTRRKTYAAIDPTRPELSAKGKTVVITGAGLGSIGSGIALSFAKAGAEKIALVGRTEKRLQETKDKIRSENPDVEVYISVADLTKAESVGVSSHWIRVELGAWDVFINSAGRTGQFTTIAGSDEDDWWQTFEIGVRFYQHFSKHFLPKCRPDATFISISSRQVHMNAAFFPQMAANGAAHAAAAKLDEYLAIEKPGLRVFSLHPGRVDTSLLQGILEGPQNDRARSDIDDMSLPSDTCVWLASPEANFLKGRFLHSNFNVEELVARRAEFEENSMLLTISLLWCWVSSDWNALRIATFYGPVWLFIVTNVFIYVKVGMVVFKWRSQLISMGHKASAARSSIAMRDAQPRAPAKSYEVQIHSQVPHDPARSERESYSRIDIENELASPTTPTHQRYNSMQGRTRDFPARSNTIVHHPTRLDANKATIAYCYTALLFFLALLITWVPSTVNRLYTLIEPNSSSPFGLDFASGLVLPLQGFWNCIIYIFTSKPACKALFQDIKSSISSTGSEPSSFDLAKPGRRKRGSQPLGSTDTRADIVISLDGKNRTVHHRSNESFLSTDDTVPEMVTPKQAKHRVHEFERHSSISDATTAGGHDLRHSQSQRSQRTSEWSSGRVSDIRD